MSALRAVSTLRAMCNDDRLVCNIARFRYNNVTV